MNYNNYIDINPDIMLGKPVIKGTRITVEMILRDMSNGSDADELLNAYPNLTRNDIYAALSYSADIIANEEIINVP